MKTRILSIVLFITTCYTAYPAGEKIKLIDLIDAALGNRGNITALRTDLEIAGLQTSGLFSEYLPQISAVYDFRYNIKSPTQIIPLGQFNPVPTDEKRAIIFGTAWQQNAGVSLYQPLFDFSIRSRVAESRINEKLKNADVAAAERDLKSEVIRSFILISIREEQLRSAIADTLRTGKTLDLIMDRADEGKVLKTDLNMALLNHNNALANFRSSLSVLMQEKMYMGFLTGYPLEFLMDGEYDFASSMIRIDFQAGLVPVTDSIPEIERLKIRAELAEKQQKTEISRKIPVLGVDGFLGASQYTDTFDPVKEGTWYGSSYVGVSLRLPILSGDNTRSRISQLRLEARGIQERIEDEKARIVNNGLRLSEEISQLEYLLAVSEQNASLLEENITIYQNLFTKGQVTAYDLINREVDLQKEHARINEQRARILDKKLEMITNSGYLQSFLNDLRSE